METGAALVKKEIEEEEEENNSDSNHNNNHKSNEVTIALPVPFTTTATTTNARVAGEGEEEVTIAQLSLSPSHLGFCSSSKEMMRKKSLFEKREKRLKVKMRHPDSSSFSKMKHAFSSHAGKQLWQKKVGCGDDGFSSPLQIKSPTMIRAEEVQSSLEPGFPSFIKSLVRSHVGSCFWMGLPGPFCRSHLPNEDTTVTLEDECGQEYNVKYIGYKTGLSAGWRQFCVTHQLFEGDVLVFQLTGHCRFKIYIVRANDLAEVDGALGLLNLDVPIKQIEPDGQEKESGEMGPKSSKRKRHRSLALAVVQKRNKKSRRPRSSVPHNPGKKLEHSENDSEGVGSEVLGGYKLSLPGTQFTDIKSFENFNILIDGLVLDSELSEDARIKYYRLCCSQNAFLHDNLIKGLNFKLIAGIICETVNIADAIRACSLTTPRSEFTTWDKTLKASELFGMDVGFLRSRLKHLVSLAFDSEGSTEARRYIEARTEREHTEEEIRMLEAKLADLKAAYERFGVDIENLKTKAESYESKFQEEVVAPW